MRANASGSDGTLAPSLGDRAVWAADGPEHECDCPGPPPKFHLPPPPRPHSGVSSDCPENSTSHFEICEAVPVIDAEYHYTPVIPSFAIILAAAAAVVVFLFIGTFLVLIKRRKMQNLLPRKPSSQNRCDFASTNGIVYEDLTNLRPRTLSPLCPSGQTTLPSAEMMDVLSRSDRATLTPAFIRSASPVQEGPYDSRELFNPVYEELSNGSADGDETESDGMPQTAVSEDEFAEDELSLAGDDVRGLGNENPDEGFSRRSIKREEHKTCRDVDSSDADDRCKFLKNAESLPSDHSNKGKKSCQGSYFRGAAKRSKSLDKKKVWKNKTPPPLLVSPANCNEFREGVLLKRIMQIYPDVTGMGFQYSKKLPTAQNADAVLAGCPRYETFDVKSKAHARPPKPELLSNFGRVQNFSKNQSQDSSLGSDSGYSNNTSGGKSSSKTHKDYQLSNLNDSVVLS